MTGVGAKDGHADRLEERTWDIILQDRDALFQHVGEVDEAAAVGAEAGHQWRLDNTDTAQLGEAKRAHVIRRSLGDTVDNPLCVTFAVEPVVGEAAAVRAELHGALGVAHPAEPRAGDAIEDDSCSSAELGRPAPLHECEPLTVGAKDGPDRRDWQLSGDLSVDDEPELTSVVSTIGEMTAIPAEYRANGTRNVLDGAILGAVTSDEHVSKALPAVCQVGPIGATEDGGQLVTQTQDLVERLAADVVPHELHSAIRSLAERHHVAIRCNRIGGATWWKAEELLGSEIRSVVRFLGLHRAHAALPHDSWALVGWRRRPSVGAQWRER